MMRPFEIVYTVTDYYDGPRVGVADFNGAPHLYEAEWDEAAGDYADTFKLSPLDRETFEHALEAWDIWLRWNKAFRNGLETLETHPALPADRPRHNQLEELLRVRLVTAARPVRAFAEFRTDASRACGDKETFAPLKVRWSRIDSADRPWQNAAGS